MANQEHLNLLQQGVEIWNQWRKENPDIQPDLAEADLSEIDLTGVNLSRAQLHGAIFFETELGMANLSEADLGIADFRGADLSEAEFSGSDLGGADLSRADLSITNFRRAILVRVNFQDAYLNGSNMSRAKVAGTMFVGVDISKVEGLDVVQHLGSSVIDIDTIYRSQGQIPEVFMRGIGLPDSFIAYARSLVRQPIDFYSCFISCSYKDQNFAERLHSDLQSKGVRCWFAPHDMRIGDELRPRIDESIRLHDKLLLVLSEHSLNSTWVKKEFETAFEKEEHQKKPVLFPIRLDDAVMHTTQAWAADIRRTRLIGDFTMWKQHDAYQQSFQRLLRDLKAET